MKKEEARQLLPTVFERTAHGNNVLNCLLDVMEQLHAPSEEILGNLDATFDPRRSFAEFIPFLASWVDLSRLFEEIPADKWRQQSVRQTTAIETGRLRELVANAAYLSKWRGTKKGLLLFLQTATGAEDFAIEEKVLDEKNQIRPFHLNVVAPKKLAGQKELIERVIEFEKPAHVTYDLEFAAGD